MSEEPSPPIEKPKLVFTLEEAAAATGYSVRTLQIAIRRNDLLARYANTKPIILVDELQDWLRSLPTEPKAGHRPLSQYGEDAPGAESWPSPPADRPRTITEPAKALFRTPEEVAPELGISKSKLRSYCRTSGINTRIGKRIMLHDDDVQRLVEWIRARRDEWSTEPEHDPFA